MGASGVVRFVERKAQNPLSLLRQGLLWANSPVRRCHPGYVTFSCSVAIGRPFEGAVGIVRR